MGEFSSELIAKLREAKSLEEVTELLNSDGQDETQAEELWKKVEIQRKMEVQELSLDELENVAGGVKHRDYLTDGCAATVEPFSDCWGTDGGCMYVNIDYNNGPSSKHCPYCDYTPLAHKSNGVYVIFVCKNCGARWYVDEWNKTIRVE